MRNLLAIFRISSILKLITAIVFLVILISSSNAATITSSGAGDWGSTSTWDGGVVPGETDDVIIDNVVTIISGTEAAANDITINSTINSTGKLVIEGNLTMEGTLTMNFSGTDESELVLSTGSKVIVKGDVSLSNKTSVNISSYFIVLGSYTKKGSWNQGDISLDDAHIYIVGDVSTPWDDVFTACEGLYDGTTDDIAADCDYGKLDDLIINDVESVVPGVAEVITTAILNLPPEPGDSLSCSSNYICSGGSALLTMDGPETIQFLRWYRGTNTLSYINPLSSPYTYSTDQYGSYSALYKYNGSWYRTNEVHLTNSLKPTLSPTGTDACAMDDVEYTTEAGQTNYDWDVIGQPGTDYTVTIGGGDTNSVTVKWLTSGSNKVTVNYTNVNGCAAASSTESIITVHPLPEIGSFN